MKYLGSILAFMGLWVLGATASDMVATEGGGYTPPIQVAEEMSTVGHVQFFVITADAEWVTLYVITQVDTIVASVWGSDINQTAIGAVATTEEWPKEVDAVASSLRDYSNALTTSITAELRHIDRPGEGHAVYPLLYRGMLATSANHNLAKHSATMSAVRHDLLC